MMSLKSTNPIATQMSCCLTQPWVRGPYLLVEVLLGCVPPRNRCGWFRCVPLLTGDLPCDFPVGSRPKKIFLATIVILFFSRVGISKIINEFLTGWISAKSSMDSLIDGINDPKFYPYSKEFIEGFGKIFKLTVGPPKKFFRRWPCAVRENHRERLR